MRGWRAHLPLDQSEPPHRSFLRVPSGSSGFSPFTGVGHSTVRPLRRGMHDVKRDQAIFSLLRPAAEKPGKSGSRASLETSFQMFPSSTSVP